MTLYNPFHARVNLLVHQLGPFLPVKFRVQHLPALLLFLERRPQSLFDQTFRYRFNHSSVNMTVLKNVLEEYFSLPEAHTPLLETEAAGHASTPMAQQQHTLAAKVWVAGT